MSPNTSPQAATRGGGGHDRPMGEAVDSTSHSPGEILSLRDFPFAEAGLSTATGLPLRVLATARAKKLREHQDWKPFPAGPAYSEKGVSAVLAHVGFPLANGELAALLEKLRAPQPPVIQARVTRFYANAHMMQLELPDKRTADLFVARRQNFKKGMLVPVRLAAGGKKYELARPLPRNPGRW